MRPGTVVWSIHKTTAYGEGVVEPPRHPGQVGLLIAWSEKVRKRARLTTSLDTLEVLRFPAVAAWLAHIGVLNWSAVPYPLLSLAVPRVLQPNYWSAIAEDLLMCMPLEHPPESEMFRGFDDADAYRESLMGQTGFLVYFGGTRRHWIARMASLHGTWVDWPGRRARDPLQREPVSAAEVNSAIELLERLHLVRVHRSRDFLEFPPESARDISQAAWDLAAADPTRLYDLNHAQWPMAEIAAKGPGLLRLHVRCNRHSGPVSLGPPARSPAKRLRLLDLRWSYGCAAAFTPLQWAAFESLQVLDLSWTNTRVVPAGVWNLPELISLCLQGNPIAALPEAGVAKLENLRFINLIDCDKLLVLPRALLGRKLANGKQRWFEPFGLFRITILQAVDVEASQAEPWRDWHLQQHRTPTRRPDWGHIRRGILSMFVEIEQFLDDYERRPDPPAFLCAAKLKHFWDTRAPELAGIKRDLQDGYLPGLLIKAFMVERALDATAPRVPHYWPVHHLLIMLGKMVWELVVGPSLYMQAQDLMEVLVYILRSRNWSFSLTYKDRASRDRTAFPYWEHEHNRPDVNFCGALGQLIRKFPEAPARLLEMRIMPILADLLQHARPRPGNLDNDPLRFALDPLHAMLGEDTDSQDHRTLAADLAEVAEIPGQLRMLQDAPEVSADSRLRSAELLSYINECSSSVISEFRSDVIIMEEADNALDAESDVTLEDASEALLGPLEAQPNLPQSQLDLMEFELDLEEFQMDLEQFEMDLQELLG